MWNGSGHYLSDSEYTTRVNLQNHKPTLQIQETETSEQTDEPVSEGVQRKDHETLIRIGKMASRNRSRMSTQLLGRQGMITAAIVLLLAILCLSLVNVSRRENDLRRLDDVLKEVRGEKILLKETVANQKVQIRQMEKAIDELQHNVKHHKMMTKLMGSGTVLSVGYNFYERIARVQPDR